MKDITRFIQEELNPRIYAHISQIFQELHFKNKGGKYVSSLHADGSEETEAGNQYLNILDEKENDDHF